ncbi:MAG TPA: DUF2934 domain-containing protein [Patescibacteria group bacterium]|nr:DUF2934 domain-containing protein [Patescibacteria group bacterium]
MSVGIEEKIRQRAFEIWEAEGRPEGREQDHWLQAQTEISRLPVIAPAPLVDPAAIAPTVKKPAATAAAKPKAPAKPKAAAKPKAPAKA